MRKLTDASLHQNETFLQHTKFKKAETPVLWPPHPKSWLIGKDSDAGRDWEQEEKGMTENEMAGWHHWLNGRESEWTPGVGDGQGCLACCDSWGHKESDTTEQLIWSHLIMSFNFLSIHQFLTHFSFFSCSLVVEDRESVVWRISHNVKFAVCILLVLNNISLYTLYFL